ncbi:PAS domain-containing protein [Paraburkholderia tropica]|uniref:sensor histidine kinase n=1 Tax=Paraburkholderia tropica TaxID=92647 RepID=UPI0030196E80
MRGKTRFHLSNSDAKAMLGSSNSFSCNEDVTLLMDGKPSTGYKVLDAIPDPICLATSTGSYLYFNEAWIQRGPGDESLYNTTDWLQYVHVDDAGVVNLMLRKLFSRGEDFNIDFRLRSELGGERWFMLRTSPWPSKQGTASHRLLILTDVHERKCAEVALTMQLSAQKQMLDITHDCIKILDRQGNVELMNRAGREALNVDEGSELGMEWLPLLPAEVHQAGREALQEAITGKNVRFPGMSQSTGRPVRHWDNMLTPLVDERGEVRNIVCVSRDISTQKEDSDRIQFLLSELDHRTRNMLAVVQAVIIRTAGDPKSEFVKTVCQRIQSIARSQDLLVSGKWTGISVRELVRLQIAISGDYESRFRLIGDEEMKLDGRVAETIGMAIYELTTNAIKYGALSDERGIVTVQWDLDKRDSMFRLTWKETGGPEVDAPQRKGFGASVIGRNSFAYRGAQVSHAFERDGVRWQFVMPSREALASSHPLQPVAGSFRTV